MKIKRLVSVFTVVLLMAGGSLAAPPETLNRSAFGDTQSATTVMAGNPHWSSTGAAFDLTSISMEQSLRTETPAFDFGNLEGHSSLNTYSDFLIQDLPSQPPGAASTILLELEHLNTLPSINNDRAHNQTHIDVSAPGHCLGFVYNSFVNIPEMPAAESEWSEFTGTRDITKNWNTLTYVGETINLFAGPDSNVLANLYVRRGF